MKDKILSDFDTQMPVFHKLKDKCIQLLKDILDENSVTTHQIVGRTKDRNSLSKKIDKNEGKYGALSEITDIVGLRVITYLDSDVDTIATIIAKEFKVDQANSTDKRRLKSNQFGYRSLHYVVELDDIRIKNTEYKSFKEIKIEVQVRSILQHAWAEIEHDLGYKGEWSIPEEFKRGFNRLAALLEVADIEFDRLKSGLDQYRAKVESTILTEPETLDINNTTLKSLANSNDTLLKATRIIAHGVKASVDPDDAEFSFLALRVKEKLKFMSIKVLQDEIDKHQNVFLYFTLYLSKNSAPIDVIPLRAGLSYFLHFYACLTLKMVPFREYLTFGFSRPSTSSIDERNTYYKRCRIALTKATASAQKSPINLNKFRPLLFVKHVG